MNDDNQFILELNNLGKDYPCPFCHGMDLDYCDGGTVKINYISVYCRKCSACGPYATDIDQARKLWKQYKDNFPQSNYSELYKEEFS